MINTHFFLVECKAEVFKNMANTHQLIILVVAYLSLSLEATTHKPSHSDETSSSVKQAHHQDPAKPVHHEETSSSKGPSPCGPNEVYNDSYDPKCEATCEKPIKILCIPDKSSIVSPYCSCLLGYLRNHAHQCVQPLKCFL
ncbi:hypothetical protein ILUMI_09334 [Ignelater luminosus]|uniref:Uncharacterized protein n=1 Tax=Ignelater luminosus TaxID=2038154 RepID=A0A8K0D4G1_IGNLU|nr:hypothetical protein ILUMI_09334 [Ignelater luminosus]